MSASGGRVAGTASGRSTTDEPFPSPRLYNPHLAPVCHGFVGFSWIIGAMLAGVPYGSITNLHSATTDISGASSSRPAA